MVFDKTKLHKFYIGHFGPPVPISICHPSNGFHNVGYLGSYEFDQIHVHRTECLPKRTLMQRDRSTKLFTHSIDVGSDGQGLTTSLPCM